MLTIERAAADLRTIEGWATIVLTRGRRYPRVRGARLDEGPRQSARAPTRPKSSRARIHLSAVTSDQAVSAVEDVLAPLATPAQSACAKARLVPAVRLTWSAPRPKADISVKHVEVPEMTLVEVEMWRGGVR